MAIRIPPEVAAVRTKTGSRKLRSLNRRNCSLSFPVCIAKITASRYLASNSIISWKTCQSLLALEVTEFQCTNVWITENLICCNVTPIQKYVVTIVFLGIEFQPIHHTNAAAYVIPSSQVYNYEFRSGTCRNSTPGALEVVYQDLPPIFLKYYNVLVLRRKNERILRLNFHYFICKRQYGYGTIKMP